MEPDKAILGLDTKGLQIILPNNKLFDEGSPNKLNKEPFHVDLDKLFKIIIMETEELSEKGTETAEFTMGKETAEEPTFTMGKERVVYLVCQLKNSSLYSAVIFKFDMEADAEEGRFEVFNRKKYLEYESSPSLGTVSCDMVHNELYLVCSYSQQDGQIRQAPIHMFDIVNERFIELPKSDRGVTPKPMPVVMAVGTRLYVYGQSVGTSVNVPLPTLETFDIAELEWESKLPPQFILPNCTSVEGYAVISKFLLISVVDFNGRISRNQFFYWNFTSSNSNSKWEKLILSKDVYYPFSGKAEFIDGVIYSCNRALSVYRVDSCSDEEGLHISPPQLVGFPEFAAPPLDWSDSVYFSFCFAYMGIGKRFCVIKTGDSGCIGDQQYAAISVVEVSDDLQFLTTLTSKICSLNISGLQSDLILTSCFVRGKHLEAGPLEDWDQFKSMVDSFLTDE